MNHVQCTESDGMPRGFVNSTSLEEPTPSATNRPRTEHSLSNHSFTKRLSRKSCRGDPFAAELLG